jgi:hypothetical protein
MHYIFSRALGAFIFSIGVSLPSTKERTSSYKVSKLKVPMEANSRWDAPQWRKIKAIDIANYMGEIPKLKPKVQAKMMYGKDAIYLIYRVRGFDIHCLTHEYNGPVWHDNAVEFFFSPDTSFPKSYFNLEINCCGIPYMGYYNSFKNESVIIDTNDIKKIIIKHSLPERIESEINGPVEWTIYFEIPFDILMKYSKVILPKPRVIWRANFYQIADRGTNPHYMTWSFVDNPTPNFHLPQYFGRLVFQ